MIVLSRIDNRLIHGQVIEAWLPHLRVRRLVVADDESAMDPLTRTVMTMAVPPQVTVVLEKVGAVDFRGMAQDDIRTLVLFRDVATALVARALGLPNGVLNVGNVHAGPGRLALSRSVFLSGDEKTSLNGLQLGGMDVRLQAVPSDSAVALAP